MAHRENSGAETGRPSSGLAPDRLDAPPAMRGRCLIACRLLSVPYGAGSQRLKPPAGLPEPEKAVFLDLIHRN